MPENRGLRQAHQAFQLLEGQLELQAESEFDAVVENGELEPALNELEALMGLV